MRFHPLLLLLVLGSASVVRAEDVAPPPPSAADVARALGSAEATERERGEALLVRALRAAPDRAALLEAIAQALRAPAPPAPPAPPASPATPATPAAPQAPRPEPPAPGLPPEPQAEQVVQAEETGAKPAAPAATPTWTLDVRGVSVPSKAAGALKTPRAAPVDAEDDGPWQTTGARDLAAGWIEAAQRIADAQALGEASVALADDAPGTAHLGADVTYRCCALPQKGGSWAVGTGTIEAGLSVRATVTPAGLRLEPTWVTVAQPIATVKERPAPGVDELELDRPDWSTARTRHVVALSAERSAALLVVPGLLADPDRVLVLVVTLARR